MRIVEESNIHSIKGLWEMLNAHHLEKSKDFKEFFEKNTFEKRLAKLESKEVKLFIAYKEEPIGYILVSLEGKLGEIDSIFLKSDYRGQGVADKLMDKGIAWLNDNGAEGISLYVAAGNEDAFAFYERFGFKPRVHMLYKLED